MVRIVEPALLSVLAAQLASIAETAFEGRESQWEAHDFIALGGLPRAAMIVDDEVRDGLIILQFAADEAEVLNFGVVPAARRRGLGRELLAAAEALAAMRGAARLFLEVAIDNAPARALYATAGFTQVGHRPGYYLRPDGSRADAVVMQKTL